MAEEPMSVYAIVGMVAGVLIVWFLVFVSSMRHQKADAKAEPVTIPDMLRLQQELAKTRSEHAALLAWKNELQVKLGVTRGAMQMFVDRVERGEIRSVHTYAQFKELLSATKDAA